MERAGEKRSVASSTDARKKVTQSVIWNLIQGALWRRLKAAGRDRYEKGTKRENPVVDCETVAVCR